MTSFYSPFSCTTVSALNQLFEGGKFGGIWSRMMTDKETVNDLQAAFSSIALKTDQSVEAAFSTFTKKLNVIKLYQKERQLRAFEELVQKTLRELEGTDDHSIKNSESDQSCDRKTVEEWVSKLFSAKVEEIFQKMKKEVKDHREKAKKVLKPFGKRPKALELYFSVVFPKVYNRMLLSVVLSVFEETEEEKNDFGNTSKTFKELCQEGNKDDKVPLPLVLRRVNEMVKTFLKDLERPEWHQANEDTQKKGRTAEQLFFSRLVSWIREKYGEDVAVYSGPALCRKTSTKKGWKFLREIDIVVVKDGKILLIIEVKASGNPKTFTDAEKQLNCSLEELRKGDTFLKHPVRKGANGTEEETETKDDVPVGISSNVECWAVSTSYHNSPFSLVPKDLLLQKVLGALVCHCDSESSNSFSDQVKDAWHTPELSAKPCVAHGFNFYRMVC